MQTISQVGAYKTFGAYHFHSQLKWSIKIFLHRCKRCGSLAEKMTQIKKLFFSPYRDTNGINEHRTGVAPTFITFTVRTVLTTMLYGGPAMAHHAMALGGNAGKSKAETSLSGSSALCGPPTLQRHALPLPSFKRNGHCPTESRLNSKSQDHPKLVSLTIF